MGLVRNQKYFLMGIRKGNISHLLFRLSIDVALVGSILYVVTKLTDQLEIVAFGRQSPILTLYTAASAFSQGMIRACPVVGSSSSPDSI